MATYKKMGWFGSLFTGAIFMGMGYLLAIYLGMNAYHMGKVSESWPTVQGSVLQSKVVTSHDSKGRSTYSADVQYAYRIGGKEYKSNKIDTRAGTWSSSDSSDAYEEVNQYPIGRSVAIHYNPDKPWVAVLEPGVSQVTYWLMGAGAVLLFIGAWIALSGILRVLFGIGMLGILTFAWLKKEK